MDVALSGTESRRGDAVVYTALVLSILSFVIAPGFLWPPYFRILATLLLLLLGILVARAYTVAIVSFRKPDDPPPKPAGVAWPTISVIVPAYNEASVLPRTMESMLHIDYPADRIRFVYVYEKRSDDGTGEIIQSYAARDARFLAVERDEGKGGKAAATNYGMVHCKSDLVVLLDADHSLKPDAVKRAARRFLADERLMCVKGRCLSVNGDESLLALMAKLERDIIEKGDIYARHLWRGFSFFGGGQAVFRREVFNLLGAFDEEILVEDIDFSVRIHKADYELVMDPLVISYEEHPAEFSGWWAQRKRWARGWMQIAIRYLGALRRMPNLSWRERLDLYMTLSYVVIPVFFVIGLPLLLLGHLVGPLLGHEIDVRDFFAPWSAVAWALCLLSPPIAWLAMRTQDLRAGVPHAHREYWALLLLWPYLVFQTTVFWAAFLDEFVLRRPSVYVKTAKSGLRLARQPDAQLAAPAASED